MTPQSQQLVGIANRILVGEETSFEKLAISVFDRWLGPDNLGLLDCVDAKERADRDSRHLKYWAAIRETWPEVLALRPGDTFHQPSDGAAYINACRVDHDAGSSGFQCAVIPAVGAIYYESWDDTNVLWFEDRTRINELLALAKSSGLHVLEYAE